MNKTTKFSFTNLEIANIIAAHLKEKEKISVEGCDLCIELIRPLDNSACVHEQICTFNGFEVTVEEHPF